MAQRLLPSRPSFRRFAIESADAHKTALTRHEPKRAKTRSAHAKRWPRSVRARPSGLKGCCAIADANVVFGRTSDPGAAEDVVTRYYPYDPHWIRKKVTKYTLLTGNGKPTPWPVSTETVECTLEEQIALWSRMFLTLPTFEFLVGASQREGMLPIELRRLTIRNVDRGISVNEPLIRGVRSMLMQRDGTKVTDLLADIAARTRQSPAVPRPDGQATRLLPTPAVPALPAAYAGLVGSPASLPVARHHDSGGNADAGTRFDT